MAGTGVDTEAAFLRAREDMRRQIRELEDRFTATQREAVAWRKRAWAAEAEVERLHTERWGTP